MAEWFIKFHGTAWVDADSEDEALSIFYENTEDISEYTIDSIEED